MDLSSSDDEKEYVDEKLNKTENELKKISTGMGKVRSTKRFGLKFMIHLIDFNSRLTTMQFSRELFSN